MTARRTDSNQVAIVAALRAAGASVCDLHEVGHGCPDLLVSFWDSGQAETLLMEVKAGKGVYTADEVEFIKHWPGVILTVRSPEDALRQIGKA